MFKTPISQRALQLVGVCINIIHSYQRTSKTQAHILSLYLIIINLRGALQLVGVCISTYKTEPFRAAAPAPAAAAPAVSRFLHLSLPTVLYCTVSY